jgi:hypothetical protein
MRLAPYCAHAGVAATDTIAADQTNIEMARLRMIRLAPVGYFKCARWFGALGSLLGRPRQNTMRHRPCSTESCETRHAPLVRDSGADLYTESRKPRRAFPFFRIVLSSGADGGVKAPGVYLTVSVKCFPGL